MSLIIRYTGDVQPTVDAMKQVLDKFKVRIRDSSGLPDMVLVEKIDDNVLSRVKSALPKGWQVFGTNYYSKPDTRRKAR